MTDLERTKEFFNTLGYEEATTKSHHLLRKREFYIDEDDRGCITMNFGDGGSDFSYRGFGFCLVFKKDGMFSAHGAFE